MSQIRRVFIVTYRAFPWIIEAGSYSLIFPIIVPVFTGFGWPIFLAEFIVAAYADRRLWISYTKRDAASEPVFTAAIWPIGLALSATLVFGSSSLLAVIPKVLLFALITSVLKYLIWEIQNLARK